MLVLIFNFFLQFAVLNNSTQNVEYTLSTKTKQIYIYFIQNIYIIIVLCAVYNIIEKVSIFFLLLLLQFNNNKKNGSCHKLINVIIEEKIQNNQIIGEYLMIKL